jgi:hypothetical protein
VSRLLRRSALTVAVLAALVLPVTARALQAPAPLPFGVGEELVYRAHFSGIPAGTARMRVEAIEEIRGRQAYHLVFTLDGGIAFYRVHDRYDSWIDVETLSSLRYVQHISEGWYKRNTSYEIWPDRCEYQKNNEPILPSVARPLDDGSFIYAVRVAGIRPGETHSEDRYFRSDRNPVVLTGLGIDTVKVGAGTFVANVVHPTIKTGALFAENTDARVWFSDDANRYPIQVKTKFAKFSVTLTLESIVQADSTS